MILTRTPITAGLLSMALLIAGCGTTSSRFSQKLGRFAPSLRGESKYNTRDLATAVQEDPFPRAGQFTARVADANVIVKQ